MKFEILNIVKSEVENMYGTSLFSDLEEIKKYYEYYDKGIDWEQDTSDYEPTKKKTNKIKQLIKDEARFLFGKTPDIKLISDKKDVADEMQNYINDVLKKNLFSSKLIKAARDCFIGKRIAVKLWINQKNEIKILFVPSLYFVFETEENDFDSLKKIVFFREQKNDNGERRLWKQSYEMKNGKCILNEAIYDDSGQIVKMIFKNEDTMLNFIPAKVIINDGLTGEINGESDVFELLDNQLEYDKLSSENIDTLRKGMNQIIYGTDINSNSIEKFKIKPGAFWDVDTDVVAREQGKQATIGTISNDFGYDTRMENTLKNVQQDMYGVLKIPNVTNEELKGFITSGKSMKALYWQLIARCQEKFMDWQPVLIWLIEKILEMSLIFKITSFPMIDDLVITVENQFPLPEDESEEKAVDMAEVTAQLMSRKRYIEK